MFWLLKTDKRKPHLWAFSLVFYFLIPTFGHLHTISPFYPLRQQLFNPIVLQSGLVCFNYIHWLPTMHGPLS